MKRIILIGFCAFLCSLSALAAPPAPRPFEYRGEVPKEFAPAYAPPSNPNGFILQIQNAGSTVATWASYGVINCSTNMTCSMSGSVLSLSSSGGTAAAGGSNTQLQFNSSNALGGITKFTTNGTTTINGIATSIFDMHLGSSVLLPGSLSTGLVTVTTGTGAVSSVAAPAGTVVGTSDSQALTNKDLTGAGNTFPTFNQNTTGSSAKWTTARNLAGNSVDGSANVAFSNKFIVQGTTDAGLSSAQFMGALGTGLVKNTTTTGVQSIGTSADIYGLFTSCTGSSGLFLEDGGACAAPAGGGNVTGSGITTGVKGQRVIANGTANTLIPTSAVVDVTAFCSGNTTSSDYGICINAAATANQFGTIDLRGLPSKVYLNSPMITPQGYILTAAGNASAGSTVYTGTFPAASNQLVNYTITTSGFSTGANNGTFTISASTATTITVNNASGGAESHAALGSLSTAQMFSGTILLGNTVFFINNVTGAQTFGSSVNVKGNGKTAQLTGPYGAGTGTDFEFCSSTDTAGGDLTTYCASTAYTASLTADGSNYPAAVSINGYLASAGAVGSSGSTLLASRISGISVGCGMIANTTGLANYSAQEGSRLDDVYWHDCSAAGDIGLDLGGGTGGAQNSWVTDCQGTTLSGKTNAASAVGIRVWAATGNGLPSGIVKCSVVNNSSTGTKPNYDVEIAGGSSTAGQMLLQMNHYESGTIAGVALGVATVGGTDVGKAVNGVTIMQDNCGPGFGSGAGTGCVRIFSNANLTGAAVTNIQILNLLATNSTPTNVIADDNNTVIPIATKNVVRYETNSSSAVIADTSGTNPSIFAGAVTALGGISTGAAVPAANTVTGLSFLDDINGNKSIGLTATGSAVDYLNVTNGAAGSPGVLALGGAGTDSNITTNITSKGSGVVQINGVAPILTGTAAGGDLSGTYPNPGVAKINGTSFAGTNGDVVTFGAANIPADSGFLGTNVVRKDAANAGTAAMTLDMHASTTAPSVQLPNVVGGTILAGTSTANLSAPVVFQNTNSTNNNTSITMGITSPGTSTGQTTLNVNGASTGGDLADFGVSGTWTAGVLSGQTIKAAITPTGGLLLGGAAALTAGTSGFFAPTEGTAFTGTSTQYGIYDDSTLHCVDIIDQTTNLGCAVGEVSIIAANTITKAVGTTSKVAASSISDDGTFVTTAELIKGGNSVVLTSDNTGIVATTAATAVTVFTLPGLKASTNYSIHCSGTTVQSTAGAGIGIAVKTNTTAATQMEFHALVNTSATAINGQSSGNLTTTTESAIYTGIAGTVTTQLPWTVDGSIEVGATAPSSIVIGFFSISASDAVAVKRDSYCTVMP